MIPQISGAITEQIQIVPYPSFTYHLSDDQIVSNIDGIEAIQQAIFHILSTERYAYPIYDNNYGVEFEKYKGQSFDYLNDTIQDTLREALLQDDRITGVTVTNVEKVSTDSALIEFSVACNFGTFGSEVIVSV